MKRGCPITFLPLRIPQRQRILSPAPTFDGEAHAPQAPSDDHSPKLYETVVNVASLNGKNERFEYAMDAVFLFLLDDASKTFKYPWAEVVFIRGTDEFKPASSAFLSVALGATTHQEAFDLQIIRRISVALEEWVFAYIDRWQHIENGEGLGITITDLNRNIEHPDKPCGKYSGRRFVKMIRRMASIVECDGLWQSQVVFKTKVNTKDFCKT